MRPVSELIPHDGAMCLLERVIDSDASRIICGAISHRNPENPLREQNRLRSVVGIEYAAQAMAVHGALLEASADRPRAGFLGAVNDVAFFTSYLDGYAGEIIVEAERLVGSETGMLYQFELRHADVILLRGRAAVVLR